MGNIGRKTVKTGRTSAPMAVKASAPTATKTGASTKAAPTFEQIAQRSYELYLARGGIDGHDVEDWLAAEAQLRA
jgi:hypothetical protein